MMKVNTAIYLLPLLMTLYMVCFACGDLSAQGNYEQNALLSRYDQRFAVMDSIVFLEFDDSRLTNAMGIGGVATEPVAEVENAVQSQIDAFKGKTGLQISGQAYVRPGSGASYDSEDPMVSYNAKFQIELEWNIFQSSLYKSANRINELRLNGELDQLEFERQALERTVMDQRSALKKRYYAQLLYALQEHAENLTLLTETQTMLLQGGKISSDDLLKLLTEKAEIDRQLSTIMAEKGIVPVLPCSGAGYVMVDTASLFSHITLSNYDVRKLQARQEILECQRKDLDYLRTTAVMPFVRFSYYNRENTSNTHNMDVGVSFKIPLSSETSRQKKALMAEADVVAQQQRVFIEQIHDEVATVVSELSSLNENIRGEYESMCRLREYLARRTDSYENVMGEYNRINRLQEYNAFLQSWERLLSYQYERDSKLISLQQYVLDEPVDHFFTIIKTK